MEKTRTPVKRVLMRQSFRILGLLAPTLAAAWAYRIWSSTHRFRESEHDKRWRLQARLQILAHGYGNIAVYHWGEPERPVVLCVHGWNGRASQFTGMLPALLKAGYQVVAFDAPGHGNSTGNTSNLFRISEVLQSVAQSHPQLQAVITHSFGGMAAAYAIKHLGLQVRKLIMIASPVSGHYLADMFAQSLGINQRVMSRFDKRLRHEFGDDVYERISVEQNLRDNNLPILLIHDKQDKAVSWRNSERIKAVAAQAVVIYTEGHGHRRPLRDKKLIRQIVTFLQSGASARMSE